MKLSFVFMNYEALKLCALFAQFALKVMRWSVKFFKFTIRHMVDGPQCVLRHHMSATITCKARLRAEKVDVVTTFSLRLGSPIKLLNPKIEIAISLG